jgi:2-oxoglutarate dehydrogenase E2 component (dihydrolipoamide succinyltransferase)
MDVLMPQLGETVMEGTVAAWHKKAGDSVEKGEVLLDIETDKVATEIEAPATGVVASLNVNEGDTVEVGTVLAVITVEGEEEAAAKRASQPAATEKRPEVSGSEEKSAGERLSPAVRRLIKEHKLDIADIQGTGRDGRVTRRDVLNHIESNDASDTGVERVPFNRVRKVTAEHMLRSKTTSPHVLQTIEADFSAIETARGEALSYLPFVARALCIAIPHFPKVNASVDGDELVVYSKIDLAIAVDLDFEGLVAPVIRDAAELKVTGLAKRIQERAEAAKAGKLAADDLRGGTYTLSNPGPFGTLFTAPIINQPQVAILSMDAVRKRPVVIESDAGDTIEIRPVGILAHSFDHRAFDGAYSAAFLKQLKTVIEETDWTKEL